MVLWEVMDISLSSTEPDRVLLLPSFYRLFHPLPVDGYITVSFDVEESPLPTRRVESGGGFAGLVNWALRTSGRGCEASDGEGSGNRRGGNGNSNSNSNSNSSSAKTLPMQTMLVVRIRDSGAGSILALTCCLNAASP